MRKFHSLFIIIIIYYVKSTYFSVLSVSLLVFLSIAKPFQTSQVSQFCRETHGLQNSLTSRKISR